MPVISHLEHSETGQRRFGSPKRGGILRGVCDSAPAPRVFPWQTPFLGYRGTKEGNIVLPLVPWCTENGT